jgi:type IV pilus assembly protein PilQ
LIEKATNHQQQTINTVSKVPVLGDIPYFGWLFRNSSNFNEKKELLIWRKNDKY